MKLVDFRKPKTSVVNTEMAEFIAELPQAVADGVVQGMVIVLQMEDGDCSHYTFTSESEDDRLLLAELQLAVTDLALGLLRQTTGSYLNDVLE